MSKGNITIQESLFQPVTILECDINTMSQRKFLAFCRKEYLKAHNIKDTTKEIKEKKEIETEIQKELFEINEKAKEVSILKQLTYRYAFKQYVHNIKRLSEYIPDEPENITENEKFKKTANIAKNYIKENLENYNKWQKETENFNEETAVNTKNIRPYVLKYIQENVPDKKDEQLARILIKWLKLTQPVKVIINEKKERKTRKEFYSKELIGKILKEYFDLLGNKN